MALQSGYRTQVPGALDPDKRAEEDALKRLAAKQRKAQRRQPQAAPELRGTASGMNVSPMLSAAKLMAAQAGVQNVNAVAHAGGNFGKGRVAKLARKLSKTNSVVEVTSLLNRLGYSSPQGHHDEAGTERDFNVYAGNMRPYAEGQTSPIEQRRLMILAKALRRGLGGPNGPLSELIFDKWGSYFGPGTRSKKPYGGHGAHGHVGFKSETW